MANTLKQPNPKIIKRNERIRARYLHLSEIKKLRNDYILELLEEEFLPLEQDTIWLIISQTGYYKNL
tara:strand:+ start:20183 stop:20383 length:201 start_codon:yes stop_codon:yes gene_type:complete